MRVVRALSSWAATTKRRLRAHTLRHVLRLVMWLLPPGRGTLVHGYPDSEENSLVMALRMSADTDAPVVLLAHDVAVASASLDVLGRVLGIDPRGVRVVRRTPGAIWLFLRSKVVLYTHGLFDSPRPDRRRVHVNLWHGTGPKWTPNAGVRQAVGATHLVCSSVPWGNETRRALSMPEDTALLTGNPRQDVLHHPASADQLRDLGLDPTKPLVLWLPTYRKSRAVTVVPTLDGREFLLEPEGLEMLQALRDCARAAEVQVVVKPHPLDAERWADSGFTCLRSEDVWATGASLHQFLGACDAMISDYSSAWVDFLELDRPVGLVCPDLEQYTASRGLNRPHLGTAAAELLLTTPEQVKRFLVDLSEGRDEGVAARAEVRRRIGFELNPHRAQDLSREVRALVAAAR